MYKLLYLPTGKYVLSTFELGSMEQTLRRLISGGYFIDWQKSKGIVVPCYEKEFEIIKVGTEDV